MRPRFTAASVLLIVTALGAGCERNSSPPAESSTCEQQPVIFVHGLDQGPAIFAPALASLRRQGVPAACLHAIELRPPDGDNMRAAEEQLAPFVEDVLHAINASRAAGSLGRIEKVSLAGHSMGALSARWYTAVVRPERVALFIATSGANHGTEWQCDHPFGEGHRQMCPAFAADPGQSALQFRLNGAPGADVDETPYGRGRDSPGVQSVPPDPARSIVYLTLRSAADRYVLPGDSLLLDGAGGLARTPDPSLAEQTSPGNFLLRERSGHDELLSSPAALRWLHEALRTGGAQGTATDAKDRP